MRNSFCRLYIHIVFSTKHRFRITDLDKRKDLLFYIRSIIEENKCHLFQGNVMPDHVHLLIGLHPAVSLSTLIQKVKANSSKHINDCLWMPFHFSWEEGYGAFSCSESVIEAVSGYIEHQEEHHYGNKTFGEEYRNMLLKQGVKVEELPTFHMVEAETDT